MANEEERAEQHRRGIATTSLVFGLLGVLVFLAILIFGPTGSSEWLWVFGIILVMCAITSIILGGIGITTHAGGRGMAMAGLILSMLSFIGGVITILVGMSVAMSL